MRPCARSKRSFRLLAAERRRCFCLFFAGAVLAHWLSEHVQRYSPPFAAVQINVDGKRKPGLQTGTHETKDRSTSNLPFWLVTG